MNGMNGKILPLLPKNEKWGDIERMNLQQAIKFYQIKNLKRLGRYLQWCLDNGWKPGGGVKCQDHIGCQYESDGICMFAVDEKRRRPCPPWDCTCYKVGKGRKKKNDQYFDVRERHSDDPGEGGEL